MEASGWRLKGCGELKRGLKNYQQGRAGIRVTLPRATRPCAETGRGELGASERKRDKRGMKRRYGGAVQSLSLCGLSAHFFPFKAIFLLVSSHPPRLPRFPPHHKLTSRPLILPVETDILGASRSRDNCLRFSPFPPLGRPFP